MSKEAAQNTIDLVEKLNGEYGGFVWCADEFYIKAGRALPPYAYYGAFSQIENGVGLFRDFEANIDYALGEQSELSRKGSVGLVTGQSFAPYLKEFAERIAQKTGLNITVFAVKNNFFGESVTVAGLVTATDIAAQVEPRGIDFLVVPSNMLKEFSDVFLDNVTLGELEQKLGVKIIVASFWGGDLIEKIIEQCQKNL